MKRSRRMVLTTVMAVGPGLSLAACDGNAPAATQWGDPPAATATADAGEAVDAQQYATLEECKAAGEFAPAACDQAYAAAEADNTANAPRFGDQQSCEERYGVDQCVPRGSGSGSFFTPLLTGFIIGQALNNFGGGGYGGRALYRDRYGGYSLANGRSLTRDYVTGRTRIGREQFNAPAARAPERVQTRSSVVSRGGFGGGGGRSYGG